MLMLLKRTGLLTVTAVVALSVGILLFLLAVAVAEHWVVRGGLPAVVRCGD